MSATNIANALFGPNRWYFRIVSASDPQQQSIAHAEVIYDIEKKRFSLANIEGLSNEDADQESNLAADNFVQTLNVTGVIPVSKPSTSLHDVDKVRSFLKQLAATARRRLTPKCDFLEQPRGGMLLQGAAE